MKVRATKDGVYAGYYYVTDEIFEIDAKPFIVKDEFGNMLYELDDNGTKKLDKKNQPIVKMATWFSAIWMKEVDSSTQVTNDYPPFQIPIPYREGRKNQKPEVSTLKDLQTAMPESVI